MILVLYIAYMLNVMDNKFIGLQVAGNLWMCEKL